MIKLKISVTKEILEKSKNCDDTAYGCAIALAVIDIFPLAAVFSDTISVYNRSEQMIFLRIPLPDEARLFIIEFDRSTPERRAAMQPISFEIEIPDEIIERINIDEVRQQLVNHPNLQLS